MVLAVVSPVGLVCSLVLALPTGGGGVTAAVAAAGTAGDEDDDVDGWRAGGAGTVGETRARLAGGSASEFSVPAAAVSETARDIRKMSTI